MGASRGKVLSYSVLNRYGFIEPLTPIEGGEGKNLFVHQSQLSEGCSRLLPGQVVEFDVYKNLKGLNATNVVIIEQPSS
eukprot:g18281.t1